MFGGGIGESSPYIRNSICEGMAGCGVVVGEVRNAAAVGLPPGQAGRIRADDGSVAIYVVAAEEETWVAGETLVFFPASVKD